MSYFTDVIYVASTPFSATEVLNAATSPTSETYYAGSALTGRSGGNLFVDTAPGILTQRLVVTTSAAVGAYVAGSAITITGEDYAGNVIQDTVRLTLTGGGEVLETALAFRRVTGVRVQAQALATGAISVGVGSVVFQTPASMIHAITAGTYRIRTTGTAALPTLTAREAGRDIVASAGDRIEVAVTEIQRTHAVFPFAIYL